MSDEANEKSAWRGIHLSRGMRLRLSEISFTISQDGNVESSPVDVSVSIDLYVYWLEIALKHLIQSEAAHQVLLKAWEAHDDETSGFQLESEFASSMQCVTSAVVALDSLYAVVRDYVAIPTDEIEAWRANRTSRPKQIAEVFRRSFIIGPESFTMMRNILIEFYKWRDWCVHPPAGFDKPVRYEELHVGIEWRFVAFRFENARNLLSMALSLIAQLLHKPRPEHAGLVEHCSGLLPVVMPIVDQWEERYGLLLDREKLIPTQEHGEQDSPA